VTPAASIIARVIAREGGIADGGDGMGITSFGQTSGWLEQFGLTAPHTPDEAAANYQLWLEKTGLLGLCAFDDILADATIDYAVNSGHRVAIRALQIRLGTGSDGVWGPQTQAAVDACNRHAMAAKVIASRVKLYGALITADASRSQYAHGWMNRVGDQIERL
jgi:lysozyme family protein